MRVDEGVPLTAGADHATTQQGRAERSKQSGAKGRQTGTPLGKAHKRWYKAVETESTASEDEDADNGRGERGTAAEIRGTTRSQRARHHTTATAEAAKAVGEGGTPAAGAR